MVVLALDCDGTISPGRGPIPMDRLLELKKAGVKLYMVSPSPACAATPFERVAEADRTASLLRVREKEPDEKLFIYVSDNEGDEVRAFQAGYIYVHPKDFR